MPDKENIVAEEDVAQGGPEDASAAPGSASDVPQDPEHLTGLLEDARNRADEHWNLCLRLQADIENLGKRAERDVAHAHKFALERFSQELLPVKDSLEMGLSAAEAESTDAGKVREGVELTLQMLGNVLEKFGIQEVNPQNERFNPEFHQAMSTQLREDVGPNTVVTVVQKGYLLNGRLIRPAMVIVSKAPEASDSTHSNQQA